MLFLAVFCGFLAEYQLEHKIERNREKQFMVSMIEDLKADTSAISILNEQRIGRLGMYDSLSNSIIEKKYAGSGSDFYYWGRNISRRAFFFSADGTMQQLKNSGGLRLIRKRNAADSIIIYDAKVSTLEKLEQRETNYVDFCLPPTYRILDGLIYDKMIYDETEIRKPDSNPALLNTALQALPEFNLTLHNVKSVNRIYRKNAIELLQAAIQLINTLKKEYKLE